MKISIITITFNSEKSLEKTIQSVISQDYDDIEYIIVDGKSTDSTLDIVEKHKQHVDILISEKDKGIYDALNKGINAATGDVIGFIHSDDIFNDDYVVSQVSNALVKPETDAVYGDLQYVAEGNFMRVIRNWKSGEYKRWNLKLGWMPPHPTFFCKKKIYDTYGGFDLSYKISADYDIMMRYLGKYNISLKYIPHVLTKMQLGGVSNRSLKTIIRKSREDIRAARKNKIGFLYPIFFKNVRKITQFIHF